MWRLHLVLEGVYALATVFSSGILYFWAKEQLESRKNIENIEYREMVRKNKKDKKGERIY